jgi:hypothetical protein
LFLMTIMSAMSSFVIGFQSSGLLKSGIESMMNSILSFEFCANEEKANNKKTNKRIGNLFIVSLKLALALG